MPRTTDRWLAGGLATCLLSVLAGCSGGGGDPAGSGPVEIEMWTWNTSTQQVVAKFNATHSDVKIKFVKQADNPTTATNLRNAVAAGQGIPCLVQNFGEVPSLLAEGLLADVTDQLQPHLQQFNAPAVKGAEVQGRYYGIPSGAEPAYMMINRKVYDQYRVGVPKTWDDIIAAGKVFKQHGVKVMNLAGEDPSTLVNLVQQAGGSWYAVNGDSWQVGFTSPESKKAANIVQQLVDNDIVANQTYQDRPALIAYFDDGKMVSLPTNVWQLGTYEENFKKSIGNWQPIDLPQYTDAAGFTTPFHGGATLVPKGCANLKEATEAGVWLATSKDAIEASLDKETGSYPWPGTIPDPAPYVDGSVPAKLFGAHKSEAVGVWLKSAKAGKDSWVVGPNYTAVFKELQDQWALAVTKKITFDQLLDHMQKFTVDDLKAKGVNVAEG